MYLKRLKDLREDADISQKTMAEFLNIKQRKLFFIHKILGFVI